MWTTVNLMKSKKVLKLQVNSNNNFQIGSIHHSRRARSNFHKRPFKKARAIIHNSVPFIFGLSTWSETVKNSHGKAMVKGEKKEKKKENFSDMSVEQRREKKLHERKALEFYIFSTKMAKNILENEWKAFFLFFFRVKKQKWEIFWNHVKLHFSFAFNWQLLMLRKIHIYQWQKSLSKALNAR